MSPKTPSLPHDLMDEGGESGGGLGGVLGEENIHLMGETQVVLPHEADVGLREIENISFIADLDDDGRDSLHDRVGHNLCLYSHLLIFGFQLILIK